jgi:hypothetical protein
MQPPGKIVRGCARRSSDDVLNVIGKVFDVVMYAAGTITSIAAAGGVEFIQVTQTKAGSDLHAPRHED